MKILSTTPAWDSAPREVWKDWQLHRLRTYLSQRVLPFSTHYRRLFKEHDLTVQDLRSLEDWAHVPFTSKSDLTVPRDQQREFVLMPEEAVLRREWSVIKNALLHGREAAKNAIEEEFRPVMLTSTTGRSSDPVPFLFTKHDLHNLDIAGRRLMECGRSQKDFRHINAFPFAPHLAFWQTHHAGLGFGTFMVSTGGGKSLGTEGNMNLIDRIQPDVLIGMPTFMYHLMREAVETGRHWPNLKRIVLGGEKVAEGLRARLIALAAELGSEHVYVISTYGFTEAKMAFPECPAETGSGFHISPDLAMIELVSPQNGLPVPDGHPGEIVFTPLDARGTVVLRYRTGDIAEGGLTWSRCPYCGRTCPRLLGPISRVSEVRELHLDKIKGTLVNFNILEHLLDDQKGVAAWQIELCKRHDDPHEVDELILHVAPERGTESNTLEQRIQRRFAEVTEIKPNAIHLHDLADMRERLGVGKLLKEVKLLDRRKQARASDAQLSSR
ncbi:Phenylacetate-coenzyme A ligase PaaK, adenylate-forming domain family [Prosthecobacter debontii]|uniref:Phenylacetate-coenzyme A ligase PaaK, adenylate-forming domain family n=1 Tax=Prosthecobacter debontii TaxID=48467 RepID=A0A1T4YPD9_9BACT|nr:AMP-binding protein [Prosthecobacter debontii]SKB03438.1 Phenylacetate-coenzyme A ligase PaaK, adenylate-forming domain family [Prosthecobacter debontii]